MDLTRHIIGVYGIFSNANLRENRSRPQIMIGLVMGGTTEWSGRTLPTSIVIETSHQAQLWPVLADVSLGESALLNLILNARDSMETGGRLTIETANVLIG